MNFMGFKRRWFSSSLIIFFFFLSSSFGEKNLNLNYSANSLDALFQNYALKSLLDHPRTGSLYKAVLPTNLSGVEVSVIRLRSGSFWIRGVNFSVFRIPRRVRTIPYVKRLALVYQNLGNLSSQYYNVPGYSMISPVIGLMAYDASNLDIVKGMTKLNLSTTDDPISIVFPLLNGLNSSVKCVRFNVGGSMNFSEMKSPNVCLTREEGHFAVVVPTVSPEKGKNEKNRIWVLWAVGFGFGLFGLFLLGLVGFGVYKVVRMKKIGEMEREADEGEAIDIIWVGNSKMPSAKIMRTTPKIENAP